MKKTSGKFIGQTIVIDPDTKGEVTIEIYKLDGGGIVGVDASFLETMLPVYSPFDKNIEIDENIFG